MVPGMSGPPGACVPPPVAVATVIAAAPVSSPRMEESHAGDPQNKLSSATSLSAQVSHECDIWVLLFDRKVNSDFCLR